MKKYLLLSLLVLLLQNAFAQDVIIKLTGEELVARVKEITLQDIVFQHPDSAQGIMHRIAKADVFMVRFANGTKEVFTQNLPENQLTSAEATNTADMYLLGREDAIRYYKGNGAMWGSAACALVFPYGLAGSAIIGFTRPKAHNHMVSDVRYLSDPHYIKGYEEQARRKKIGKAAAGAGIGTATIFVAAFAIVLGTWQ